MPAAVDSAWDSFCLYCMHAVFMVEGCMGVRNWSRSILTGHCSLRDLFGGAQDSNVLVV